MADPIGPREVGERAPGATRSCAGRRARTPVLAALGIDKSFGATQALRGANIALHSGEVHAVLGENGAGKSTLVKILVGAAQPDAGRLEFRGEAVRLGSVRDAVHAGVIPIYQHLSLMPHLSIRENLFAFEWAGGPMWRGPPKDISHERARQMLARVGLDLDPRMSVGSLSLAERQLVEIARGVARDCAVLVLDEPTASLNRAEADNLFAALRELCVAGKSVLFISHNLNEVEEIADRVSVLRDGVTVVDGEARDALSRHELVERMIGHRLDTAGRHALPAAGVEVLRLESVGLEDFVADVSLEIKRGELLGLAGLIGSGAAELGFAVAGLGRFDKGQALCDGQPLPAGDRVEALAAGIGLIPAERENEGVFPGRTVLENMTVADLGGVSRCGWLSPAVERRRFLPWMRTLHVTPEDPDAPIDSLSGGNQQKVLLIRGLARQRLRILVALDPTRGVDVGARDIIHRALIDAAGHGTAILVVSSDLDELAAICHRILVMRDGRLVAEWPGDTDPSLILRSLTGGVA